MRCGRVLFKMFYTGYFFLLGALGFSGGVGESFFGVEGGVNKKSCVSFGDEFFHKGFKGVCSDTLTLDSLVVDSFREGGSFVYDYIDRFVLPDFDLVKSEFETKRVPVLMFHKIGEREDRYTVSPRNFERILSSLYENDFYSVSLGEFLRGDFSGVPVGKKPVLLTFDDSHISQFKINGEGVICDKSAVGIMGNFYESHDFGKYPTMFPSFVVDGGFGLPFGQNEFASEKLRLLLEQGYSIAYHTVHHENNAGATKDKVFEQKFLSSSAFYMLLGGEKHGLVYDVFAHPFGQRPRDGAVFNKMKEELYPMGMFDAWNGASRHPLSGLFDLYRIPRIEITYYTLEDLVLNLPDVYVVTPETKTFYVFVNELYSGVSKYRLDPVVLKRGLSRGSPSVSF